MGDNLVPNGLSSCCKVLCSRSKYQKALAIKPDYVELHYNIATALQGLGRFDEAAKHNEQALATDPVNLDAHNNLGAILIELGRSDEALPHFERALAISPNSAQAHSNIGMAST